MKLQGKQKAAGKKQSNTPYMGNSLYSKSEYLFQLLPCLELIYALRKAFGILVGVGRILNADEVMTYRYDPSTRAWLFLSSLYCSVRIWKLYWYWMCESYSLFVGYSHESMNNIIFVKYYILHWIGHLDKYNLPKNL